MSMLKREVNVPPATCDFISVQPKEQMTIRRKREGGREREKKHARNLSHGEKKKEKSGLALYAAAILHGLSCSGVCSDAASLQSSHHKTLVRIRSLMLSKDTQLIWPPVNEPLNQGFAMRFNVNPCESRSTPGNQVLFLLCTQT